MKGALGQAAIHGHHVAHVSDRTGQDEVWIRPWPGPGTAVRVSQGGGGSPRWAADGKSIYFVSPTGILRADVSAAGGLKVAVPELFYDGGTGNNLIAARLRANVNGYDVGADGRTLLRSAERELDRPDITVVLNFFTELRRLVPSR